MQYVFSLIILKVFKDMYLVKIASKDKNSNWKGMWYFKPNSVEQVVEHFNTIWEQYTCLH